jgi:hypothetical protein
MSLFVATFLALVFAHFARFYQGRAPGWILVVIGVPVVLNFLRAALGLAYRLERHPFRTFDLGLVDDGVAPGHPVEAELVLEARRSGKLRRLAAGIRATRRFSTERGRQEATLHDEGRTLERDLPLEPGLRKTHRIAFALPPNAPYSFRSMEGKIVWAVRVEAEVEDWGTLADEIEVTVGPR